MANNTIKFEVSLSSIKEITTNEHMLTKSGMINNIDSTIDIEYEGGVKGKDIYDFVDVSLVSKRINLTEENFTRFGKKLVITIEDKPEEESNYDFFIRAYPSECDPYYHIITINPVESRDRSELNDGKEIWWDELVISYNSGIPYRKDFYTESEEDPEFENYDWECKCMPMLGDLFTKYIWKKASSVSVRVELKQT